MRNRFIVVMVCCIPSLFVSLGNEQSNGFLLGSQPSSVSEITPRLAARQESQEISDPAQNLSELRSYLYPDELVLMYGFKSLILNAW